jgi:hypothetical protein
VSRPFVKQGTYEGYRAAVRVHLISGIGRHRLASLRPEHLERLYVAMLKIQKRRGTLLSPGRVHQFIGLSEPHSTRPSAVATSIEILPSWPKLHR